MNEKGKFEVGGYGPLSHSAVTALDYAATMIAKDHKVRNGRTALFWHLVSVAAKHIGDAHVDNEKAVIDVP